MAEKKRFLLRVDQKVYDSLEKWAEDEFRSVNAQIELIIKKALKDAGRLKKQENPKDEK
ncbi:Arc family DNA-binding protein [Bacillus niameyensis]|uniref:Arc family DNA-binding protein n=1 Tax=Bacillus niameyensis TaxID=1522308 RepID=UPI0009FFF5C5|nr:Arc family DNA-binding protein [Bacillus niameyensis]